MSRIVTEALVDRVTAARVAGPRDGYLAERPAEDGRWFEAVVGPWRHYRRVVEVTATPGRDDVVTVRQTIDYRLAVPVFAPLFALPFRQLLGRLDMPRRAPWWAPPDAFDARAAGVLSALAVLSIVTGYLGTLLTETVTYAAREFGADKGSEGLALGVVRTSVLVALPLVFAADRHGRRRVALLAATGGCLLTALGAAAPTLPLLAATQIWARGCAAAVITLIGVMTAEEMPAGSRAYAVSLLVMAAALGSGMSVLSLPLTSLGLRAWRLLFVAAVLGLPLLAMAARHLPESKRFVRVHARGRLAGHVGRLALLAGTNLLANLWGTPASQFQNDFLRVERHFSPGMISVFTVATYTPASLGIVVGGKLADTRGRRRVGAVALLVGTFGGVVMFFVHGWAMWLWSLGGNIVFAATVPALAVYGPELFPTGLRGKANGVISAMGALGGAVGLVTAGQLASAPHFGTLGVPLAILALGPATVAVLVLTLYPETAHRELEELNPEDAAAIRAATPGG